MGTSDTNSVLKTSRKAMYISLRPQAVTCMAVANPNTQRPYNLISTYKLKTCPTFSPSPTHLFVCITRRKRPQNPRNTHP